MFDYVFWQILQSSTSAGSRDNSPTAAAASGRTRRHETSTTTAPPHLTTRFVITCLEKQGRIHGIRCVHARFGQKRHFRTVSTRVWPTDRRKDGRTNTPSYRDARTHLKTPTLVGLFLAVAFEHPSQSHGTVGGIRVKSISLIVVKDRKQVSVWQGACDSASTVETWRKAKEQAEHAQ